MEHELVSLPSALANCVDRYTRQPIGGDVFLYSRLILDTFLTLFILIANIFIICSIILYRRKHRSVLSIRATTVSMKFVLNLAFADVFVGVTVPYYLIAHYFCSVNEVIIQYKYLCLLKYFGTTFACFTSNSSIIAIAIDRYIAVVYPLRYRQIMTKRLCYQILAAVWIIPLLSASVLLFWNHWSPGNLCDLEDVVPYSYVLGLGSIGHSVMLVIVAVIHFKVHQEATSCYERNRSRESGLSNLSNDSLLSNIKSAKTVILVTGVYFLCWTPYSICLITRVLHSKLTPAVDLAFQITFPLSYSSSFINSFIYAWRNSEVKSALVWFVLKFKFKKCRENGTDLWIKKPETVT